MAFEQRAGGAEFGQDLVFGHRLLPSCGRSRVDREQGARLQASCNRGATCLRDADRPAYKARA